MKLHFTFHLALLLFVALSANAQMLFEATGISSGKMGYSQLQPGICGVVGVEGVENNSNLKFKVNLGLKKV